jgi:hypothetical protein
MSVQDKIESVNAMAKAMRQIKCIEIPVIEVPSEELGGGAMRDKKYSEVTFKDSTIDTIGIDGADDWWNTWCEIRGIINDSFDENVGESGRSATLGPVDLYASMRVSTDHISLGVDVYSGHDVHFVAEYASGEDFTSSGGMLYEGWGDGLDEIELGRAVAGAEQEIIAHATESAAETIDYWQTELSPNMSQSRWADTRNVGRQTVNDRVQSARDVLDE